MNLENNLQNNFFIKKIIYSDQKCGTFQQIFREKILVFLLLLFPLLCFTNKSQGNGVCAKKSASGSTTAFLVFGSPLVCFTNHSIMVFGQKVSIQVPHHQSFLRALCILAIETSLQNCSQQVRRTHSSRLPFKFKFYSTGWFLRRSSTSSGTKSQP